MAENDPSSSTLRLLRPVDHGRDHLRGRGGQNAIVVVAYLDFLCPYCRRLREVFARLREALGDRLVYVLRHFPNERANPGAELWRARQRGRGQAGRFWEMYDSIFGREPPIDGKDAIEIFRT